MKLVEHRVDRRKRASRHPMVHQDQVEHAAIGEPGHDVLAGEPERPHDIERAAHELRVRANARFADDVDVELEVLAQPAALLAFVSEELRNREPPHRLGQRVRAGRDHPGKRRSHFRTQCDRPATLVRERVQLPDDLLAALLCIQLRRFERRPVVLRKPVPARDIAPRPGEGGPFGELRWIEIAEPGECCRRHHGTYVCNGGACKRAIASPTV
jgi:hypothetical protein